MAVVEQVFERRAKQIDDQDIVEPFLTKIIDIGYASWIICQ